MLIIRSPQYQSLFWEFDIIKKRSWMILWSWPDIRMLAGYIAWFRSGSKNFIRDEWKRWNEIVIFHQFQDFIREKYKTLFPDHHLYQDILLLASNNDPEKAFDLFFELFDEYKKEKGIIYEWDNPTPVDSDEEESIGQ